MKKTNSFWGMFLFEQWTFLPFPEIWTVFRWFEELGPIVSFWKKRAKSEQAKSNLFTWSDRNARNKHQLDAANLAKQTWSRVACTSITLLRNLERMVLWGSIFKFWLLRDFCGSACTIFVEPFFTKTGHANKQIEQKKAYQPANTKQKSLHKISYLHQLHLAVARCSCGRSHNHETFTSAILVSFWRLPRGYSGFVFQTTYLQGADPGGRYCLPAPLSPKELPMSVWTMGTNTCKRTHKTLKMWVHLQRGKHRATCIPVVYRVVPQRERTLKKCIPAVICDKLNDSLKWWKLLQIKKEKRKEEKRGKKRHAKRKRKAAHNHSVWIVSPYVQIHVWNPHGSQQLSQSLGLRIFTLLS